MRISTTLTALSLVMFLAACGSGTEESTAPADTADAGQAATNGEGVADAGADAGTGPETASAAGENGAGSKPETAAPSASAAASPADPSRSAVVAAAAKPPAGFVMCGACHKVEPGQHGIGPSLAGVFGSKAGQADGFEYSLAMKGSGLTWNEATLNRYLENPRAVVPDSTMIFVGEKNAARRQAVIDYLKTL